MTRRATWPAIWTRNLPYSSQILYLPQNVNSAGSAAYLRDEYARMLGDIEAVAGRRVTDADLRRSIAVFNENRRLLRDVYAIKRETPWLPARRPGLRARGPGRGAPPGGAQHAAACDDPADPPADRQVPGQDPHRAGRGASVSNRPSTS